MEESKEGGPAGGAVEGKREKGPTSLDVGHRWEWLHYIQKTGCLATVVSDGVTPGGSGYGGES